MKKITILLLSLILLQSCGNDDDPYLIDVNRVGPITRDIKIHQLDSIFPDDSIVNATISELRLRANNETRIYEKGGKELLIIEPIQQFDTTSTIGYIQVLDSRFQTSKGLNNESTFGDIVENYTISRIENTLNSAVVFIDELNIYITIDKKDLPSSLRYDTDTRIRSSQIPDDAKFKYFMVGW